MTRPRLAALVCCVAILAGVVLYQYNKGLETVTRPEADLGLTTLKQSPRYQRFVPIVPGSPQIAGEQRSVPWHGYFALDTKTGQLCHTVANYPEDYMTNMPSCLELFKRYPDPN